MKKMVLVCGMAFALFCGCFMTGCGHTEPINESIELSSDVVCYIDGEQI